MAQSGSSGHKREVLHPEQNPSPSCGEEEEEEQFLNSYYVEGAFTDSIFV